jgi:hypothetical protein
MRIQAGCQTKIYLSGNNMSVQKTRLAMQSCQASFVFYCCINLGYFTTFSTGYWISVTVPGSVWLPFSFGRR